jgi:uncharacterized protein HemX
MLCRRSGVADISGADAKQWLLDNALYTVSTDGGMVLVFDRNLTERDALKLLYNVDDEIRSTSTRRGIFTC